MLELLFKPCPPSILSLCSFSRDNEGGNIMDPITSSCHWNKQQDGILARSDYQPHTVQCP